MQVPRRVAVDVDVTHAERADPDLLEVNDPVPGDDDVFGVVHVDTDLETAVTEGSVVA